MISFSPFGRIRRGSVEFSGSRRPIFPFFSLLVLLFGCGFEQPPLPEEESATADTDEAASEIVAMLEASAASWNGGDLEGFLDDYWRSNDLTFSGPTGVTRGWENVRTRYLESYWAPGAVRDSLRFEDLEVHPLGASHALALGRYVLFRPEDGGTVTSTGYFSLVLERQEGAWRIVHDHTSATPLDDGSDEGNSQNEGTG